MKTKLIIAAVCVGAIALGAGTSAAAPMTSTSAKVTMKKAGAPAKLKLVVDNTNDALVPEPISTIKLSSSNAEWNSKGAAQCNSWYPTNAGGTNGIDEFLCPAISVVGSGSYVANTGTPGEPIPADLGALSGKLKIYNYKPYGKESACLMLELQSDMPVPNAHQYIRVSIYKSGTAVVPIPKIDDWPPAVKNIVSPPSGPRVFALSHLKLTIKSPAVKKARAPLFTLKKANGLGFNVTVQH